MDRITIEVLNNISWVQAKILSFANFPVMNERAFFSKETMELLYGQD